MWFVQSSNSSLFFISSSGATEGHVSMIDFINRLLREVAAGPLDGELLESQLKWCIDVH